MIGQLACRLVGHEPYIYSTLPDGTPIRGCARCGSYVRRQTTDPRPVQRPDPRFQMDQQEQDARRKWAIQRLRRRRG